MGVGLSQCRFGLLNVAILVLSASACNPNLKTSPAFTGPEKIVLPPVSGLEDPFFFRRNRPYIIGYDSAAQQLVLVARKELYKLQIGDSRAHPLHLKFPAMIKGTTGITRCLPYPPNRVILSITERLDPTHFRRYLAQVDALTGKTTIYDQVTEKLESALGFGVGHLLDVNAAEDEAYIWRGDANAILAVPLDGRSPRIVSRITVEAESPITRVAFSSVHKVEAYTTFDRPGTNVFARRLGSSEWEKVYSQHSGMMTFADVTICSPDWIVVEGDVQDEIGMTSPKSTALNLATGEIGTLGPITISAVSGDEIIYETYPYEINMMGVLAADSFWRTRTVDLFRKPKRD